MFKAPPPPPFPEPAEAYPESIKLLVFKVTVGVHGCSSEESHDMLMQVNAMVERREIPGYAIHHYIIADPESSKTDITLLYPAPNTFVSEKDLLDLLVSKGEVPQAVLDKIKKEITIQ